MNRFNSFLLAGVLFLTCGLTTTTAQVTIGAETLPDADAVLELVSSGANKGLLLPRVSLFTPHSPLPLVRHVTGMLVYNLHETDSLISGIYINDGTQWAKLRSEKYLVPEWFYMPSFPLDVSEPKTFHVNLWQEYKRQFDNTSSGNHIVSSNSSALKPLPSVKTAREFDYYVIGYDDKVFSDISITQEGVLNYKIESSNISNVSDSTFMNIVFVVKQ